MMGSTSCIMKDDYGAVPGILGGQYGGVQEHPKA